MIRELRLKGTPYERGVQHGAALATEIHTLYDAWVACAVRQQPPVSERELLSFVGSHHDPAAAFAPHWMDEIRGIADGAKLDPLRVFALNCWDELCSWFSVRSGEMVAGCTSFALRPNASGRVLIGQNQDASGWWRPVVVLREEAVSGDEPATICTGHAGVIGTTGINEDGIALVANSLIPADRGPGAPFTFVMRQALRQRSLEEAVETVVGAPRATGANYVLASTEAAIDLETTRRQTHLEQVHELFTHSNHYLAKSLIGLERGAALLPDTYRRPGRLQVLISSQSRVLDVKDVIRALSDHDGRPTSICRHRGDDPRADDEMETLGAVVAVPDERALYVTDGFPCSNPLLKFAMGASGGGAG